MLRRAPTRVAVGVREAGVMRGETGKERGGGGLGCRRRSYYTYCCDRPLLLLCLFFACLPHTTALIYLSVSASPAAISKALGDAVALRSEQGGSGLNGAHRTFVVAILPLMVDNIVSALLGHHPRVDFSRWHIFFVDELGEKLDANFHNARDELLAKLPIRPAQVYVYNHTTSFPSGIVDLYDYC